MNPTLEIGCAWSVRAGWQRRRPPADVANNTCLAFCDKTSGKLVTVAEDVRHMTSRGYPRSQLDRGCINIDVAENVLCKIQHVFNEL